MVKVYCSTCSKIAGKDIITTGKIDQTQTINHRKFYFFKKCKKCGGEQYEYFKPGSKPKLNKLTKAEEKMAPFGDMF